MMHKIQEYEKTTEQISKPGRFLCRKMLLHPHIIAALRFSPDIDELGRSPVARTQATSVQAYLFRTAIYSSRLSSVLFSGFNLSVFTSRKPMKIAARFVNEEAKACKQSRIKT